MKPSTYRRVIRIRERNALFLRASILEDRPERGAQRESVRLLRRAIAMGQIDAMNSLAVAYESGRSGRRSVRMAISLYRRCARAAKSDVAANNLAITLRDEGRITSAIQWFRRAVNLGSPDARLPLAKLLLARSETVEARRLLEEFVAAGPQETSYLLPGKSPVRIDDEDFLEGQSLLQSLKK